MSSKFKSPREYDGAYTRFATRVIRAAYKGEAPTTPFAARILAYARGGGIDTIVPCARYMPEDKWRSLLDGNVEEDNSEESEAMPPTTVDEADTVTSKNELPPAKDTKDSELPASVDVLSTSMKANVESANPPPAETPDELLKPTKQASARKRKAAEDLGLTRRSARFESKSKAPQTSSTNKENVITDGNTAEPEDGWTVGSVVAPSAIKRVHPIDVNTLGEGNEATKALVVAEDEPQVQAPFQQTMTNITMDPNENSATDAIAEAKKMLQALAKTNCWVRGGATPSQVGDGAID